MTVGHVRGLPIRWKLVVAIVFVATAVSALELLLFSVYDAKTYLEYTRVRMRILADVIGTNSFSALQFRDHNDAKEVLESLHAERSIRSAYLFDRDGGVLAEYIRPGESLSIPLNVLSREYEQIDDDNFMLLHRIVFDGKRIGSLFLTADLETVKERRRQGLLLSGGVGLFFFFASVLLALRMQSSFTAPISALTSLMRRITEQKDYGLRASITSTDEFSLLADGFNFMLSEVEQRDKALATQMQLLERSNKELDQFVYVASHDLKAPLRAVDNLARLIVKATKDLLPPDKMEYLDLMQSRIKRMETLFDDLLLYSRVGRVEAHLESVNVTALLHSIVDLLAPPPGFSVLIPDDLPRLKTQKTPLEQVFRNLIGNAIKHHNRTDGRIEISARDLGTCFEFSVSDDGPGIAANYHEKIFEMFQTLRPRDEVEGSGMGLALVKKIVENLKGTVRVSSAEGKGTSFYFTWMKVGTIAEEV